MCCDLTFSPLIYFLSPTLPDLVEPITVDELLDANGPTDVVDWLLVKMAAISFVGGAV